MQQVIVIKRRKRKEIFIDKKKVYASIYFACTSAYLNEIKCEKSAEKITKNVKEWLKNKKSVNSNGIRNKVIKELKDRKIRFYYDKNIPDLSRL